MKIRIQGLGIRIQGNPAKGQTLEHALIQFSILNYKFEMNFQ